MDNIFLWVVALPACIIDKLNEKNGGIFGGNIRPFLTSAIAEALYIAAVVIFIVPIVVNLIRR